MKDKTICQQVKKIICEIAELDFDDIDNEANLVDELNLDSLTLLEISEEVDYAFLLDAPRERLQEMTCVQDFVDLVRELVEARGELVEAT